MSKYFYQPLDKPSAEFRLLRIRKDPLTGQPQCSLQKYRLTTCPEYIALSYTWGKPTPTRTVAVEGANLEVRRNLFDFLHAYITEPWGMGDIKKPMYCWIDQICINQEDLIERSDQVRIMDKIYRQARNVLVWLGCDPDMIEAVRRLRDDAYGDRQASATLLNHPYFSRIWIIQEIILSVNRPLVFCGGIELTWRHVCSAGYTARRLTFPSAALGAIDGHGCNRNSVTLEKCISSHYGSKCHDPRDKVYALLGLTPEKWRMRVDYTKEVLEVYFDAVAALYEELFDITDPGCLYPENYSDMIRFRKYCNTLVILGRSMRLPQHHLGGLGEFLEYIQDVYLNTEIRNVRYTYTGRIYNRVRAQSSPEQILAPEEEEVEVSWGSITATRRNPLLRDIIPEMGLQLAGTTTERTDEQSGYSVQAVDRWWCKHNGEIHYFDCDEWW